jgi:colanic acid/amylovoran biosynthesis glycosyltransferase
LKILYVVSGMNLTFVVNELEAHEQAGWEALPLVSCRPEPLKGFSKVMVKWSKRAVYRPIFFTQILAMLREIITRPIRFAKICCWSTGLFFQCPIEFSKAVYELAAACYFASYCRKFEAQHIHVHFASRSLSLGIMLSMLTKLPVSCTVHAFDLFTRNSAGLKYRLSKCKFIAAISNFNIEFLRENCGQEVAGLCHVVHCGIDVTGFHNIERVPQQGRMLCVARLDPKKGLDIAIKACAKLKEQNINFLFEIIGDGSEHKHLEELIDKFNLANEVRLLGAIPNDRLMPFFSRTSIFLMPCVKTAANDMDGIPVAMMEAMSCGMPVVSSDISGLPELIKHGYNGWMVPEKDVDALVEILKYLLQNHSELMKAGENAIKSVQTEFRIEENAQKLRGLISE